MTNSPLRNSVKAQMSKQSQTSIKTSILSKGSATNHDTSCKRAMKKIPYKETIREPSLRNNPSRKGIPSVNNKTHETRNENLKVRTKRAKERALQKIDSFPRHTQKDNKMMNGLYNTLIQINHTGLARSPYFGSLSNILRGKDFNQDRVVKTQKRAESKKLPTLKNCLNPPRRTSNASLKTNKSVQTTVVTSESESVLETKKATIKGKSTSCKNIDSSSTKLPIVAERRGTLTQKPSNNNLKASTKVKLPQTSKVNVQKGNTTNLRPPPGRYLGHWDNEIRNYYNWTSFCLIRRYRSDTKMLKEQLKNLGREGCSINDVIWKEAETFRKNIEKDRKKLDAVLKVTTKDKLRTTKKKSGANKKLPSKTSDSLPAIRTPERKRCAALVPPPSASESLFIYRKQERSSTPTLVNEFSRLSIHFYQNELIKSFNYTFHII